MELLPSCLAIGITPEQFWKMNPSLLEPYSKAEELKEEKHDTHMWMMGSYIYEAFSVVLANAFRKKGTSAKHYRDKPYMMEAQENGVRGELTKEEKVEKTETLFKILSVMQANFELEKKFKEARIQEPQENATE